MAGGIYVVIGLVGIIFCAIALIPIFGGKSGESS